MIHIRSLSPHSSSLVRRRHWNFDSEAMNSDGWIELMLDGWHETTDNLQIPSSRNICQNGMDGGFFHTRREIEGNIASDHKRTSTLYPALITTCLPSMVYFNYEICNNLFWSLLFGILTSCHGQALATSSSYILGRMILAEKNSCPSNPFSCMFASLVAKKASISLLSLVRILLACA